MTTAVSYATGYRASDPRVTRDPDVWWTTAYCDACRRLCWTREDERRDGRAVRCTVCMERDEITTLDATESHD